MQRSVAISTHWMALAWVPGKDRTMARGWGNQSGKMQIFLGGFPRGPDRSTRAGSGTDKK